MMKGRENGMKICLLNDSFPPVIDGVANVMLNYAKHLSQRKDTEVMVGTPYYPGAAYTKYPFEVIAYDSLDVTALTGGYRAGAPFPIREIGKMAAFQPDIIHTHCPISSCFVARALRDTCGAPVVLTYHTKYDCDIRNAVKNRTLQEESIRLLINNVSACDEVWAVSKGAGENLRSLGYEGEYRVVENGVDFPKGRVSPEEEAAAVKEYDLPGNVPVFLFVGRLMDYKGLPLITEALRMLAEREDFRMVMIGKGNDGEKMKRTLREYGISCDETTEAGIVSHPGRLKNGKVIFTGPVTDRNVLRAWNTRADLFVFPSVFDTNGLVVREAAACALASVVIRGSCAAEGMTDGQNGFMIEETPEALASFLLFACGHISELHEAGRRAMDEIYVSWEEAVGRAALLYGDLLERKKAGLLKEKRRADDGLFEMTADAVRKYMEISENDLPYYESMLENCLEKKDLLLESAVREVEEKRGRIREKLRKMLG